MKKGFTLIELLAVIAIIGVMAVIVIPNIMDSYKKSLIKKMIIEENNVADAAQIYVEEHCLNPLNYKGEVYTCPTTYTTNNFVCLSELQDPGNGNAIDDYYVGDVKYGSNTCYGVVKFIGKDRHTYLFCGTGGNFAYTTDSTLYNTYKDNCGIS